MSAIRGFEHARDAGDVLQWGVAVTMVDPVAELVKQLREPAKIARLVQLGREVHLERTVAAFEAERSAGPLDAAVAASETNSGFPAVGGPSQENSRQAAFELEQELRRVLYIIAEVPQSAPP